MSLVRIALRIAAVQALKGRTDVGQNVLDSRFGALDVGADGKIRTDQKKPFLAVYTDGAVAGDSERGRVADLIDLRALNVNGLTDIVIEAGVAEAMVEIDPNTDEATLVGIGIAPTDDHLETQLDFIVRQACNALNDPDDEWADVFRGLTNGFAKIERARAANAQGTKFAAHQIRISASLVDDPLPGEALEPDSALGRFLAKAATVAGDADLTKIVAKIVGMTGGADPDWKMVQRHHGLTQAELLALGRGPIVGDEERSTPDFDAGTAEVAGTGAIATEEA